MISAAKTLDLEDRPEQLERFLANAGWAAARRVPLAGDASRRSYIRLLDGPLPSAILMNAPPSRGEDVRPFVTIAAYLAEAGFSSPRIFAADETEGFLLLEDFGDALFARVIEDDPEKETALYSAACDMLLALADAPLPAGTGPYGPAEMAPLAGLAATWYGGREDRAPALAKATAEALTAVPAAPPILALRDFHAENLVWLPDRRGTARGGLLDFQDGLIGHPAYDLASIVRDARRDVAPNVRSAIVQRFAQGRGFEEEALDHALAALGAQRNLRILCVFARLTLHIGKPHNVDLIPRVWALLTTELGHPALADLIAIVSETLPEPSPAILEDLKQRCGTIPKLA